MKQKKQKQNKKNKNIKKNTAKTQKNKKKKIVSWFKTKQKKILIESSKVEIKKTRLEFKKKINVNVKCYCGKNYDVSFIETFEKPEAFINTCLNCHPVTTDKYEDSVTDSQKINKYIKKWSLKK